MGQNSKFEDQETGDPKPIEPEITAIPTQVGPKPEGPTNTLEEPLPKEFVVPKLELLPTNELPESTQFKKMNPLIKEGQRKDRKPDRFPTPPPVEKHPEPLSTLKESPPAAAPSLPTIDQSSYELFEEISRDELGRLLRAKDPKLDRQVALKEGLRSVPTDIFLREVRLIARLHHAGIRPIYEMGKWPTGDPFYTTKPFSGKTLEELVREQTSPPQRLALLPRFLALVHTIAYAHSQKVVHLDLRSKNVLFGAFGEICVTGWSYAQRLDQKTTYIPAPLEEPAFRAPELEVGTVSEQADIYSLGGLLYYLLTGVLPVGGASLNARAPWVPKALAQITERAMHQAPEMRPSAQELAQVITQFEKERFADSYVPPPVQRAVSDLKKHWLFAGVCFALIALFSLSYLSTRSTLHSERETTKNEQEKAAKELAGVNAAKDRAEQRNATLTLLFAHDTLDRDPTYAVGLLKSLPNIKSAAPLAHLITADAQTRGFAKKLLQHKSPISRIVVSPDGEKLASASEDNTIRLWTLSTAESRVILEHDADITSLAFSPDGKVLASTSRDMSVRLASVQGDAKQKVPLAGGALDLRFSPDGSRLVVADSNGAIYLWDASCIAPGQAKPCAPSQTFKPHEGEIYAVRFSPDGQKIASAGKDRRLVISGLDGAEVVVFESFLSDVWDLAFAPDGQSIASAGKENVVRLWKMSEPKKPTLLVGHSGPVPNIVFSSDGRLLASASYDGSIRLWDLTDEKAKARVFKGHKDRVYRVAFSPDGTELASTGKDGTVRRWDLSCLSATEGSADDDSVQVGDCGPLQVLRGHQGALSDVAFVQKGALASAGKDATIRLWELTRATTPIWRGHEGDIYDIALSPDNNFLATASADKTVRLWDLSVGQSETIATTESPAVRVVFSPDGKSLAYSAKAEISLFRQDTQKSQGLSGHSEDVNALAFSPDGKYLASASSDKTVHILEASGGAPKILKGHTDAVLDVVFSPDGKSLASAGKDKTVRLWTLSGEGIEPLTGHKDVIYRIAFSPDGKHVASASKDKTIKLWDIQTRQARSFEGHEDAVSDIAFSPDGKYLASASFDKTIRLWEVETGEGKVFSGHEDKVRKVSFTSDGLYLVSASEDGTARRWDVASGLEQVFNRHKGAVFDVAVSSDGKKLLSAGRDKTVRSFSDTLPFGIAELRAFWEQATSASIDASNQLKSQP